MPTPAFAPAVEDGERGPASLSSVYVDPGGKVIANADPNLGFDPLGNKAIAASQASLSSITTSRSSSAIPTSTFFSVPQAVQALRSAGVKSVYACSKAFDTMVSTSVENPDDAFPRTVQYPKQCGEVCCRESMRERTWPRWSLYSEIQNTFNEFTTRAGGLSAVGKLAVIFGCEIYKAGCHVATLFALVGTLNQKKPKQCLFVQLGPLPPFRNDLKYEECIGLVLQMEREEYVETKRGDVPHCLQQCVGAARVGALMTFCGDEFAAKLVGQEPDVTDSVRIFGVTCRWLDDDRSDRLVIQSVDDRVIRHVRPRPWRPRRRKGPGPAVDAEDVDFDSVLLEDHADTNLDDAAVPELMDDMDVEGVRLAGDDVDWDPMADLIVACGEMDPEDASELQAVLGIAEPLDAADAREIQLDADNAEAEAGAASGSGSAPSSSPISIDKYLIPHPSLVMHGDRAFYSDQGVEHHAGNVSCVGEAFKAQCKKHSSCVMFLPLTKNARESEVAVRNWLCVACAEGQTQLQHKAEAATVRRLFKERWEL